jgi:hypothetical protein
MSNLKHIEALQQASLELESQLRANGRYSKDCNRLNDALTRGQKSGVALLWGADGKLEVVSLNNGADHVSVTDEGEHVTVTHAEHPNPGPEEKRKNETNKIVEEGASAYEQMGGKNWEQAKANSHVRENETKGRFEPQSHAKDAARLNAELKAKQTANAAKEKAYRADAIARNERIFADMKQRSAEIHK